MTFLRYGKLPTPQESTTIILPLSSYHHHHHPGETYRYILFVQNKVK